MGRAGASSDDLLVGEPVIAIGNPFGLSSTVTTGVISALDRSIRTEGRSYYGFIQTDASINPGNSGGPLLNAEGTLVGINTAIYQGAQGIGFAVPISVAKRVVEQLLRHGEIAPVWLGVDLQDLDSEPARRDGGAARHHRRARHRRREGRSRRVARACAAATSSRASRATRSMGARDVYEIVESASPDQDLDFEVWRGGTTEHLAARAERIDDDGIVELADRLLGLSLARVDGGGFRVKSVRAKSAAEQIGFRPATWCSASTAARSKTPTTCAARCSISRAAGARNSWFSAEAVDTMSSSRSPDRSSDRLVGGSRSHECSSSPPGAARHRRSRRGAPRLAPVSTCSCAGTTTPPSAIDLFGERQGQGQGRQDGAEPASRSGPSRAAASRSRRRPTSARSPISPRRCRPPSSASAPRRP